jgi:hypothetical protein
MLFKFGINHRCGYRYSLRSVPVPVLSYNAEDLWAGGGTGTCMVQSVNHVSLVNIRKVLLLQYLNIQIFLAYTQQIGERTFKAYNRSTMDS